MSLLTIDSYKNYSAFKIGFLFDN